MIRAGIMDSRFLEANAMEHYRERLLMGLPPEYALSVACLEEEPEEEILRRAKFPNAYICLAVAGPLEDRGYTVRITDTSIAHADLVLPSEPSEDHWQRLRGIFSPPATNPMRWDRLRATWRKDEE